MRHLWAPTAGLTATAAAFALGLSYPAAIAPAPPEGLDAVHPGPAGQPMARRTVVVIVDGARRDLFVEAMRHRPGGAALLDRAALFAGVAEHPAISRPAFATLGSGATAALTGVAQNAHRGPLTLDSIFSGARRAGIEILLGGDVTGWWSDLFAVRPEERARDLREFAARLGRSGRILACLHVAEPDGAAHRNGAASELYRAALARSAQAVLDVAAALDLGRDFLLFASDHGHRDRGGHGGPEPEVVTVPLWLAGRGVRPGTYGEARLRDVAPTVAVVAGLALPAHSEGSPLWDGLALSPTERDDLAQRWLSQRWRLANAVVGALGGEPRPPPMFPEGQPVFAQARAAVSEMEAEVAGALAARDRRAVWIRLAVLSPVFLLAIYLLARRRPPWSAPALALGAAGLFYAVWGAVLPFSLSAVRSHSEFYVHLALIALLTQGLVAGIALGMARSPRLRPLVGPAAWWTLTVAVIEVAAVFGCTGFGVWGDLPSPAGYLLPGLALTRLGFGALLWGCLVAPLFHRSAPR